MGGGGGRLRRLTQTARPEYTAGSPTLRLAPSSSEGFLLGPTGSLLTCQGRTWPCGTPLGASSSRAAGQEMFGKGQKGRNAEFWPAEACCGGPCVFRFS